MISIEFEYKHAADTQLLFRHEMKWGITYPILTDIVRGLYNGAASVKIKDDSSFLDETVFHAFPGVASSDEDLRAVRGRMSPAPEKERDFLKWAKYHGLIKNNASVSITRYWHPIAKGEQDGVVSIVFKRAGGQK